MLEKGKIVPIQSSKNRQKKRYSTLIENFKKNKNSEEAFKTIEKDKSKSDFLNMDSTNLITNTKENKCKIEIKNDDDADAKKVENEIKDQNKEQSMIIS